MKLLIPYFKMYIYKYNMILQQIFTFKTSDKYKREED